MTFAWRRHCNGRAVHAHADAAAAMMGDGDRNAGVAVHQLDHLASLAGEPEAVLRIPGIVTVAAGAFAHEEQRGLGEELRRAGAQAAAATPRGGAR